MTGPNSNRKVRGWMPALALGLALVLPQLASADHARARGSDDVCCSRNAVHVKQDGRHDRDDVRRHEHWRGDVHRNARRHEHAQADRHRHPGWRHDHRLAHERGRVLDRAKRALRQGNLRKAHRLFHRAQELEARRRVHDRRHARQRDDWLRRLFVLGYGPY